MLYLYGMRALVIFAIVSVAVIMGISTVAPALQQAFAHDVNAAQTPGFGACPEGFAQTNPTFQGEHPDHNFNNVICENIVGQHTILIDDVVLRPTG